MKNPSIRILSKRFRLGIALVVASVVGCSTTADDGPAQVVAPVAPPTQSFVGAPSLTVSVVDETGTPVSGWRWLLEEDVSYPVQPGVPATDSPGVAIHKSHAPTLASGETDTDTATIAIPDDRRSYLSVLPKEHGWQMSGTNILPGQTEATVVVHSPPLPTAEISVYVFEDNKPLNNAPDIPAEAALEGFSVTIEEQAGQQMMDFFGNPIGTTYVKDAAGEFILDADGAPVVEMMGEGYVLTDTNGEALIKNLPPGKYAVLVSPPVGTDWVQTSTLEGGPTIDAWVGHAEPPWLVELGWFMWHSFFGFVHPMELPGGAAGAGTISGTAHYVHENRPPVGRGNWVAGRIPDAWVALNDLSGSDEMVYAQPTAEDGSFTIENVPPGTWQLVVFDYSLDAIIDFRTVVMPDGGDAIDLGAIGAFAWFGNLEGTVFNDLNGDAIQDPGEMGIPNAGLNLRFTDGTIYQSTGTDNEGKYFFHEVFPFFQWLIAEVDYARFWSTGARVVVDDGGEPAPGEALRPQAQPDNGGLGWRTEVGSHPAEILLEGMMVFAGQTNIIDWGKKAFEPDQNGGIVGITYYATTRAEDDPRLAAMEEWEPGIPRTQVELYQDVDFDGVIDDLDGDGLPTRADVDSYPLGWREGGGAPGPEDWDRDGDGVFDPGDAVQIGNSDSFDDSAPTGCPGDPLFVHGTQVMDCAETIHTWNQVRPALFDGGYAFASWVPGGLASGGPEAMPIAPGYYIVGVSPPAGYLPQREEDKNVLFGEEMIPFDFKNDPVLGPPVCVGEPRLVPAELALFPGEPGVYGGQTLPLCDLKEVHVGQGENVNCDFPLFTEVPKAGRVFGMVRNDLALTFDPNSPIFRDNLAPAWMPIAMNDWTGLEIGRFYTDEFGHYTALVPSTYTIDPPQPSGVAPNVLQICVNDPGPIPDPENPGQTIEDPWFNPAYAPMCLEFEYQPGKQTPLDTPVIPIAAFSQNAGRLDCEPPDRVPLVAEVSDPAGGGPFLPSLPGELVIKSRGLVPVPNPDYDPTDPLSTPLIDRDFGFGVGGTVTIGGDDMTIDSWSPAEIRITVPGGTSTGQLLVTRSDSGMESPIGVTVQIGSAGIPSVVRVAAGGTIQAAIDSAPAGALVLIPPGTYRENLIVAKPLKLQGYGPFATILEAGLLTPPQQAAWDVQIQDLIDTGAIELLPGQLERITFGEGVNRNQPRFFAEKGSGILVSFPSSMPVSSASPPRIDGLGVVGAVHGGGIFVNAYVRDLALSNLRILRNSGNFGGGIRSGTPSLVDPATGEYVGAGNLRLRIDHDLITGNGGIDGGGGIALFAGSDGYEVTDSRICGNMAVNYGGGIAHFGLSDGGTIARNVILSNQSFDEGAGIMVAGELALPGTALTPGSGSVVIDANRIEANMAGDDGGGIRTLLTNGQDVAAHPADPTRWWELDILNNLIVNNVSWDAGGGISFDDSARVFLVNDTIAHNDATSNNVDAFGPCVPDVPPGTICPNEQEGGGLSSSVPKVGGIASFAHSAGLQAAFDPSVFQEFTDPVIEDCVIWQNRSFYWDAAANPPYGGLAPDVAGGAAPYFWDLAVAGTAAPEFLSPRSSILTDTAYPGGGGSYDGSNEATDPQFVDGSYFNTFLATAKGAAMGNFVMVTFQLPGSHGDYHLGAGSSATNLGDGAWLGSFPELDRDIDRQGRPFGGGVDAGADERH
ncbi:MAG: hypothetical protein HY905_11195 [Deltaproteobacteria bacterium]|nr:hypothetical protein [Deltaproteobacteria bacterium]